MLSHTDLKKGVEFLRNGYPWVVLESSIMFKGRGSSCMQVKMKNLITGNVLNQNFKPGDSFEEPDLKNKDLLFVYSSKGKFVFCNPQNKAERVELTEEQIGSGIKFLKPNAEVEGVLFEGKFVNIVLPIKVNLRVVSAPPSLRAGRAEAGTKQVVLETGATINAPIFINEGDIIEINTETASYVKRV
ncbi:MAG: elongation factor P [bacterium]|nr:elongation factor P [bacterium]